MRRFVLYCSVASWLGSSDMLLSPALAQVPPNTCQIVNSQAGRMFANGFPTNRLESLGADSYFRVECNGNHRGKIRLSLGAGSQPYNGAVSFKVTGANGIVSPNNSEYSDAPVVLDYLNQDGIGTGQVYYQVRIVSIDRSLLPAASDYTVKLQAEAIQ